MSDVGWKKIGGKNFRLIGISHKVPLKLSKSVQDNSDYWNTPKGPESYRLQTMAALARENGLYARVVPMARDKTLGRQRWGLYVRPKESYSWNDRFNGSTVKNGKVVEWERPKEWSEDVLSRNKRRAGQVKSWRAGRNMMWKKMSDAFAKAEKTAYRGGTVENNEEFIDSVNDYMKGTEVRWKGIKDHQGVEMRKPDRLYVNWNDRYDTRLDEGNVAFRKKATTAGGWEMPSTVGSYLYDRMMEDARRSSRKR